MAATMEAAMFNMHACVCKRACAHVHGGAPTQPQPQWVKTCEITKNLIKLDLIEIIRFCLKIYDLWTHSHLWIDLWVGGWVDGWVSSCQIIKNRVNRHLIEIIQFYLKIYDLWVSGWGHVKSLEIQ